MVFGLAPGYVARTTTVGGTTSGYSLIGNRVIAINPMMKMTIESTPAKIGRRMKKWEKFMAFAGLIAQVFRRYQEAPSSKFQRSPNHQTPKRCAAQQGCLGFGPWSFSGAWSLIFGAFSFRVSSRSLREFALSLRHSGSFATRHRFLRGDGHAGTNALQAVDHDYFLRLQAGADNALAVNDRT